MKPINPVTLAQKPFNLILLGDPASGKGTQAARLIKRYRFFDLDMGCEIRRPAVRARFDFAATTAAGHLTPTAIVRSIFKKVIASAPPRQGILFNGTPKMINEAKLVARLLKERRRRNPLVIYLTIPAGEMFKRAALRNRDDDTALALRNRQKYYKEQISRVVAFFGERYTVKKISGMGAESAVAQKIEAVIKKYLKDKARQYGTKDTGRN